MYGFKLGQIEGLSSSIEKVNLTITGETSVSYVLNYVESDSIWNDNDDTPNVVLYYQNEYKLFLLNLDESDVGDEYTINLSLPEEPTQSFTSATHEAQKSGYVIPPDVYYDGEVTLTDDDDPITLSLQGNPDVEHFSEWNVTINGNAMTYYSETNMFIYADVESQDRVFFGYMNGAYLLATDRGTFIGVFPFKVQYGSASVEQSFADAVQMSLGEKVLWEGDTTVETPEVFAIALDDTLIRYNIYANGELLYLAFIEGPTIIEEPNVYGYIYIDKNQNEYEIYVDLSTGTATLACEGHIKIVSKVDKCLAIYGSYDSGSAEPAINIAASIYDISRSISSGMIPSLIIGFGAPVVGDFNAVAPIILSGYGGTPKLVCDIAPGQPITWSIDADHLITGTVGGIN